jgi:hypothetical protein
VVAPGLAPIDADDGVASEPLPRRVAVLAGDQTYEARV